MNEPSTMRDAQEASGQASGDAAALEIVGHKTFSNGSGGFRHEPLTRAEADALWESAEAAEAARDARYPTAEDAIQGLWDAQERLKKLGWREAQYAPADRKLRPVLELGSTGIHQAYCEPRHDRPHDKWWWIQAEGDLWPSEPILYFPDALASNQGTSPENAQAK